MVALLPLGAAANVSTVRLRYLRAPGAESCPDERWIRQAVAARLGVDPFTEPAELTIDAKVFRDGTQAKGSVEVRGQGGESLGQRELVSATGDCLELASAMELAISIAVDPASFTRPQPLAAAPATPPSPSPATPAPSPAPSWMVQLAFTPALGFSQRVAAGGAAQVAARWEGFSLGVELRTWWPTSTSAAAGRELKTYTVLGSAVPCLRAGRFGACGLLSGGALRVSTETSSEVRRWSTPVFLAGLRAEVEWQVWGPIWIRPSIDGQFYLSRTSVVAGATTLWETPPLAASASVAVGARFR